MQPGGVISGSVKVPGDKSISHRSLMLGAIAQGVTEVTGILDGADCLATAKALRQLGVSIDWGSDNRVLIEGVGLRGFKKPEGVLDFGNSGTSIRLFCGLLAGSGFEATLTGDESLNRRPMGRIAKPLSQMGVELSTTDGCPPLTIRGHQTLTPIVYEMPMASAQVKSAILLAGLYADGVTQVIEPKPTRDHSETMLRGMGVDVRREVDTISLVGPAHLTATQFQVPGDFSSAAFLIVSAAINPGSRLELNGVGINPTRTGLLDVLGQMGAQIELTNTRLAGGEPVADLVVHGSQLRGINVDPVLVPLMIDEFPVLFAAAAVAQGETLVSGAEELRTKESDRLASMAEGLQRLGVDAETRVDGIRIRGGRPTGGSVASHHDHRIAMSFAVLAQRAQGPVTITGADNVVTSFPGFDTLMSELGLRIQSLSSD